MKNTKRIARLQSRLEEQDAWEFACEIDGLGSPLDLLK